MSANKRNRSHFGNDFGRHFVWPATESSAQIIKNLRDQEKLLNQLIHADDLAKHLAEADDDSKRLTIELKKLIQESSNTIDQTALRKNIFLITELDIRRKSFHPASDKKDPPNPENLVQNDLKIVEPPGSLMASISGFLYSKKTHERIFEPIIADFRNEYYEELSDEASRGRLFFVHIRHWYGFIAAVALQAISALSKVIGAYRGAGK